MGKPNYRVVVSFDPQRGSFSARAPELEHLTGEGPSRKDAIAKLEEEIDAQLANMLSLGSQPPKAVDEIDHTGEVSAKISKGLHRELFYLSQSEGVGVDQLVSELLAAALTQRQGARGTARRPQVAGVVSEDFGNRLEAPRQSNADGNRADGNRSDGNRGGGFRRGGNPQLLDDRANFIEYVRNQEQAPPAGNQNRGGGFPRNNNNNDAGGGNRRRRGRGGGQGPQQGQPGQQHGRDPNRDPNRNREHQQNRGPRLPQGGPPQQAAAPGAPAPAPSESHE